MCATIIIDDEIKEQLIEKSLEHNINLYELANYYLLEGIKNNKTQFRLLTLEEIRECVKPIAREYKMKQVYLFGSYARGKANLESDVDLLIDTPEKITLIQLSGFLRKIKESIGRPVDVVTVNGIDESFKKRIWNDKILIYEE